MIEVSVVIPAWNEAARIRPTLIDLASVLRGRRFELIVVDDGSTDETAAVCEAEGIAELRVLRLPENRGKGHAVRTGMRNATGAVRVMCDADGSMSAAQLPGLIAPVLKGRTEIAVGSRYVPGADAGGQPWWRQLWSRFSNAIEQRSLAPGVRDIHTGYKAFSAAAASELFAASTLDGWVFDLELLALGLRRGYRVLEVPIRWRDDPRSRVNPLKDLGRVLAEVGALERRLSLR